MSLRELVLQELDGLPEQDLDRILAILRTLKDKRAVAKLGGESALARDWITPEEDAAWANL